MFVHYRPPAVCGALGLNVELSLRHRGHEHLVWQRPCELPPFPVFLPTALWPTTWAEGFLGPHRLWVPLLTAGGACG